MAMSAVTLEMAIGANLVFFFFGLYQIDRVSKIVTIPAVFFLVAINTLKPEEINMFIVVESNDWSRLVWSVVYLGSWHRDNRM